MENNTELNFPDELFNEVYLPYINDQTPLQIFFGGSSSGKSYCIAAQRVIIDILKGGRNYLILRNVGKSIRGSVYNEIIKCIGIWNLDQYFKPNKSDFTITCTNGYQILFSGLDDPQKLKSITPIKGVVTDILYEEATEDEYNAYKEVTKRLRGGSEKVIKREIFLFNPILKTHWIYKEFFQGCFNDDDKLYKDDKKLILKTTYKDNKFLTQQDIDRLENETDEYFYNVYTLGNWGVLGALVFTNWEKRDLSEIMDKLGTYDNGLDFGFTNDPSVGVRLAVRDDTIYITKAFYEYGLTNRDIAGKIENIMPLTLKSNGSQEQILGDSAEPKSIWELNNDFNINIRGANKKPGSVNHGIQWIKQYKIVIHYELQDIINEFEMYQWKEDKDGNILNIPVDKFNHGIDAIRYALSEQIMTIETEAIEDLSVYGIPI